MKTFFNGLRKVEEKQHAKVTEPSATQVLSQSSTECFLMTTLKNFWLGSSNQIICENKPKKISKSFLFYLREISCTYCVPEPWNVGAAREALLVVTLAHIWALRLSKSSALEKEKVWPLFHSHLQSLI